MKTSAVLASLLFGSYAVAAPFDRRALVYKTEVVTETVVVYTTVYDDEYPEATSSAPAYEQQKPSTTSTAVVYPTSSAVPAPASTSSAAPAYTPVVPEKPSTPAYTPVAPESSTPAAETSTSIYTPEPIYTPKPSPTPSPEPEPETSSVVPPPAPTTTEAAYTPVTPTLQQAAAANTDAAFDPAEPGYTSSGVSSGSFTDVDMTVYDNFGTAGACGVNLKDDMMIAAIAAPAWNAKGGSTYDTATGKSANPWCGTEIEVEHNGKTVKATILDLCPACVGHDIDLSHGAWKELGLGAPDRFKASWSVV